jgi:hypothetical protein
VIFEAVNLEELNSELEFLKNETKVLSAKIFEQNGIIKNLIDSFSKKLSKHERKSKTVSSSSSATTTSNSTNSTATSDRLSSTCCTVDMTSDSFNLNSQVNKNTHHSMFFILLFFKIIETVLL